MNEIQRAKKILNILNKTYELDNHDRITLDQNEYEIIIEDVIALAENNLGGMQEQGQGVAQDYQEAAKWFRLAGEQGHTQAQFNLGGMYGEGISVIQNYVIAHMWFNIAASNEYEDAKKGRDSVAEEMTSEQLAEAQKLARECVEKNYKDCG